MVGLSETILQNLFFHAIYKWLTEEDHQFFLPFETLGDFGVFILNSLKWTLNYLYFSVMSAIMLCIFPVTLTLSLIAIGLTKLIGKDDIANYALTAAKISFDGIIISFLNLPLSVMCLAMSLPFMLFKVLTRTMGTVYDALISDEVTTDTIHNI